MREIDRLVDALYGLMLETGELISANPLSVNEMENKIWPLYHHIRAEGVRI